MALLALSAKDWCPSMIASSGAKKHHESIDTFRRAVTPKLFSTLVSKAEASAYTISGDNGSRSKGVSHILRFFVWHFIVMYALQSVAQLVVISMTAMKVLHIIPMDEIGELTLIHVDAFLVVLFACEVGVHISMSGMRSYLQKTHHIIDFTVLILSAIFCSYSLFCGGHTWGSTAGTVCEAARHCLRIVRTVVFVTRLAELLHRPLDHFSFGAESLNCDAEELI